MKDTVLLLIAIGFFYVLGRLLMSALSRQSCRLNSVIYISVGIGIFSYFIYVLGILGLFHKAVFQLLLVLQVLTLCIYCVIKRKSLVLGKMKLDKSMTFLATWIIFNFIICFSNSIEIDSLAYHLYCPKIFLKLNGLYFLPYNANSLFPMLNEMFYTYSLGLNALMLTKMFHFLSFILILGTLYYLSKEFFSHSVWIATAFIFVSIPGIINNAVTSQVDLTMTLFCFLSLYCFLKWRISNINHYFLLMGIFSGFAISTKYLGLFVVIIITFMMLYEYFVRRDKIVEFPRRLLSYLIIVFLCGGWWYLRAFLLTGNPFYPYLYQFFGPKGWHSDVGSSIGMGKDMWHFLLGFWNLSVHPDVFGGSADQIGVIFLCFIPLLFLVWHKFSSKERTIFIWLGIFCSLYYTLWFFTAQAVRFMYPVAIVLSIMVGVSITKMWQNGSRFNKVLKALFIVILSANFSLCFYYQLKKAKGVFSGDKESYLRETSRTYAIASWVNRNISHNEKILVCGEPGIFHFEPFVTREIVLRYITQYNKNNLSKAESYDLLKSEDFSYVILRRWYSLEKKSLNNFPVGTIPYHIMKKEFPFINLLHKESFVDKGMGTFEYYVYKL